MDLKRKHARNPAPAVYRFICPDGRSYIGSAGDYHQRSNSRIQRKNPRLLAAYEQHPPETWTFEILERLTPGCSKQELQEAEQRQIDRWRSWAPECGFNILPADGKGPRGPRPPKPLPQPNGDIIWGAEAIGVTERQVFWLLERGAIPATKIGGKWCASRARLLARASRDDASDRRRASS
jgi:hypothetical protein